MCSLPHSPHPPVAIFLINVWVILALPSTTAKGVSLLAHARGQTNQRKATRHSCCDHGLTSVKEPWNKADLRRTSWKRSRWIKRDSDKFHLNLYGLEPTGLQLRGLVCARDVSTTNSSENRYKIFIMIWIAATCCVSAVRSRRFRGKWISIKKVLIIFNSIHRVIPPFPIIRSEESSSWECTTTRYFKDAGVITAMALGSGHWESVRLATFFILKWLE